MDAANLHSSSSFEPWHLADYLLENKFENVNRYQKNSMLRQKSRQHKSDSFENSEKEDVELPEILVGTKYDDFNLGTDERPIVLRRGKKPKNNKNYKKRKIKNIPDDWDDI